MTAATQGAKYTIGVDFGSESGRAVLVDIATGREVATAIYRYRNGVLDEHLPAPDDDVRLAPDWALQDPLDYIRTFQETVPAVLAEAAVNAADVVGVGIDFTACTMLPTTADGTPLCALPEFRRDPHAWVKLWKHHAAQPQADRINELARQRGEAWLASYGGRISSEWFFAKSLQILDEAPHIYRAADRLIEAADWVVWRLTGNECRNSCTAGYKAMWSKDAGFPSTAFFAGLDSALATIVADKMSSDIASIGERAGGLTAEAAAWTTLVPGTPVAVANVDAHVSVPASTVTGPGTMVAVMGTSICHLVLGSRPAAVEGMCGVVEDGIVPGLFGFEAGQSAVGDLFAWFVETSVPPAYHAAAAAQGIDVHAVLEREAARLQPGENGLVALDWWNGNRSILVDADLTGLIVGATLATRTSDIYRSLIEATAFGTRVIIEAFEAAGVAIDEVVACGGLPERNRLLMQVYADVTGRVFRIAASTQTAALGSAMFGAVAAGAAEGGYDTIDEATERMARLSDVVFRPNVANRAAYDALFAEYRRLHDDFGRGESSTMKRLKAIRAAAIATATVGP
ncbi:MAG: ribulokinase [Chloroflexi bacterium]|nr:ribulokinase [Chloroflexota bacterium]